MDLVDFVVDPVAVAVAGPSSEHSSAMALVVGDDAASVSRAGSVMDESADPEEGGMQGAGSAVVAHADTQTAAQPVDFKELHSMACRVSSAADRASRVQEEAEAARLAVCMAEESERLWAALVQSVPEAVMSAARQGLRTASIVQFEGSAKYGTFCYLYLIKGPHNDAAAWQDMQRAGCVPLLTRLRDLLRPAGFRVWHAWDRATNDNTVCVAW